MAENEHYFNEETKTPLQLGLLSGRVRGAMFEFYTSPPVFSWGKFDSGTITLAKHMKISGTDKKLLDLGCGYGLLGIVAAHFNPQLEVTLTDISSRAILLAYKNIKKYRLDKRVKVLHGNLYEALGSQPAAVFKAETRNPKTQLQKQKSAAEQPLQTFDVIISNPPYSAGKTVVNKIIEQSLLHLNIGGSLQIVGRKAKGGELFKQKMMETFGNCEEFGIESGYRIYRGVKNA